MVHDSEWDGDEMTQVLLEQIVILTNFSHKNPKFTGQNTRRKTCDSTNKGTRHRFLTCEIFILN